MAKHYPEVNPNPDFPKIEEAVLALWEKENIFKRSVDARPASDEFIFYDGPPFANGLPHYGHLLTGYVKDLFARYQTMKGKRVERRFGWDCHGLPAEMGSEKELGISGRAAITDFGIGKFNEHCRTSVMKYTQEWEEYVTRQARWVDFKNDYKTMDKNFMESVLWAFKQLYDKGLVYEAYRVMPYSWAAETPLSNFETKLDNSYREREDKAIYVTFDLKTPPPGAGNADIFKIAAWTTTPWTLPSNLALAVGDLRYACITATNKKTGKNECHIVSEKIAETYEAYLEQAGYLVVKLYDIRPEKKRDIRTIPKTSLLGLSYHPLFPYFSSEVPLQKAENAFRILDGSNFVTDGDGTGIVHMAPGFGEDDFNLCQKNEIGEYIYEYKGLAKALLGGLESQKQPRKFVCPVDGQGKFTDEIYDIDGLSLKGLNVIAEPGGSKFGLANDRIIDHLKKTGQLIKQEQIKHNYPHCWRTDTPLIYRAMPSWYVEVTKFRDRAVELNKQINWIPEHIRDGQMGHMLATAPDWSISRNRFWGTPIPVWRSKSGKIKVFGSIAEIEKASGQKVADLHRPIIDDIIIKDGGEEYTRVSDVFDCWFESGSMPFAQVHYPFENKEWFEAHFPADFITEYVGQTRGWFNTLIMLSTALFDKPPFQNCVCHGVVLDSETGLKYSKRLKNYKDPMEVMDKFGADALRWLMISSPVMRGLDLAVDPEGKFIRDVVRLAIKPIWNAYNFFCLYANADGIQAKFAVDSQDVMDRYILAKCKEAVKQIEQSLDAYDTPSACDAVSQFFEALNNWYIRRNKERFWKHEQDADKQAAYDTLYTVLTTMCRAAAPLLPLTLDEIYKTLTGEESVHLADFPSVIPSEVEGSSLAATKKDPSTPLRCAQDDNKLIAQMDWVRDVCNTALAVRNKVNIRVRQPLETLNIVSSRPMPDALISIIEEEVNVKSIRQTNHFDGIATFKLSINNPVLGKRLPALMKQIIPASKKGEWKQVDGTVEICGEKLLPEEYTLQLEPKPEYKDRAQALSTNDALVILDTTITPELEAEGIARDLVRMIQEARKSAGLHVSDHISLGLQAPESITRAATTHKDYIGEQTLAKVIAFAAPGKDDFVVENTLDEHKVIISLSKCA